MTKVDHNSWFVDRRGIRSVWRATVVRTVLPGLLTIILFVGAIFFLALPALKTSMMNNKRETARELTTTAWALLNTYAEQVPDNLTLEEAQQRAIRRLRELRYGPENKDYFWINDMQPRLIMHPYRTELEGTDVSEFEDVEGKKLFAEMVRVVRSDGGGFVDYMWWWKDSDRIEPKLSFVKGFEPWGWVVGTGIYIEDVQAEVDDLRRRLTLVCLAILGVMFLLVGFMVWQARLVETRRVQVETSLLASERKFRGIFHGTVQFIGLLDRDGALLEINDTALGIIGVTAGAVCGRPFWETPWWTGVKVAQERVRGCVEDCRASGICRFDAEIVDVHDQIVLMEFTVKPLMDGAGEVASVVVEGWDVTEKTLLQEQLRQSQKMEAIGQLAGGVAHDFNNILMGIMGHAELMLDDAGKDSEEAESLSLIIDAAARAGDLTRQLLSFSRKGKLQTTPVDLHGIVREVASLLSHSIDRRITVRTRLEAERSTVNGDPTMLQSAILNLGVNARDAMSLDKVPEGQPCILTFATRVVDIEPGPEGAPAPDGPTGPCLELSVSDTGIGIDPKVQSLIFEPFFTTKGPSEGTGLGLAGVQGCVQSHGGRVDLESAPDRGSTFRVLLPLETEAAGERDIVGANLQHGAGHILLVDDEEILRNFATMALGRLGYRVTTCNDGREAVAYYREHGDDVDLIILDLIMQNMGGEEAFRLLRGIDPDVKVLISSGFSRNNIVSELIRDGACGFLGKPYKLGELSGEIARVIGSPS